jgi:hypothetical protein
VAVQAYLTKCCGLVELDRISSHEYNPEEVILYLADIVRNSMWVTADYRRDPLTRNIQQPVVNIKRPRMGFFFVGVVGSQAKGEEPKFCDDKYNYGELLAKYIEENNLGIVSRSAPSVSWTGNVLVTFIWAVNYTTLMPLLDKLDAEYVKRMGRLPEDRAKKAYPQEVPRPVEAPVAQAGPEPQCEYEYR